MCLADFGNHEYCQRRILSRLEHYGVAGANGRSDLECSKLRRCVPRHDRADHSYRFAAGIAQRALSEWHGQPLQLPGKAAKIAKGIRYPARLAARLCAQCISGLGCNCASELLNPRLKRLTNTQQLPPAISRGNLGPAWEGFGRCRNRPRHVLSSPTRHLTEWLATCGIFDRDGLSGHGRHPFAANQHGAIRERHGRLACVVAKRIHRLHPFTISSARLSRRGLPPDHPRSA